MPGAAKPTPSPTLGHEQFLADRVGCRFQLWLQRGDHIGVGPRGSLTMRDLAG